MERVALTVEPGRGMHTRITHFTPVSENTSDQVNELVSVASCYGNNVSVLGCNGAAVNTGPSSELCRLFELIKERPVHWLIC